MLQKKNSILFFNKSTFKVAELIFKYPTKSFHLRELTRRTSLSTTAISDAVSKLGKFGILTVEKTKLATNIRANLESKEYRDYHLIFNLYRVKRYVLDELLISEYNPKCIVLFGSFAKGEDIEKSDIDLLILTSRPHEISLEKYEKIFNRKIELHLLKSLENSKSEFKNAVSNGIILQGHLKVV